MELPTTADVAAAHARIAPHVVRTPMLRHPLLDERVGGTVLLKAEPLQRTGSFKVRGATNAVRQLTEAQRRAGVVTYSSGNHGQALASAAAAVGAGATVFMPADAPRIKVESTRRWGAAIISYDRRTEDRAALADAHVARTGAVLVPPFEHPHVIAGQGTLALELVQDAAATQVDRLVEVARDQPVTIDLETMTVTTPYQDRFSFELDPFRRQCLMEGLDEIGLTLARDTAISKFEGAMAEHRPWIEGRRGYEGIAVEGAGRT